MCILKINLYVYKLHSFSVFNYWNTFSYEGVVYFELNIFKFNDFCYNYCTVDVKVI